MTKIIVRETIVKFHEVEMNEELEADKVVDWANEHQYRFDTGLESIEKVLQHYKDNYGFDYSCTPNVWGSETVDLSIEESESK